MHRGFTLVETIVVIAISTVLLLAGAGIFVANNRYYQNESGEVLAINAARSAADQVSQYARAGTAVLGNYTFNSIAYSSGANDMIFKVPAINASGDIIASAYDTIIFGKDPNNASRLVLIVDGTAGSVRSDRYLLITDKLSALTLAWNNADPTLSKNVTYTISISSGGRDPVVETINGEATLRN